MHSPGGHLISGTDTLRRPVTVPSWSNNAAATVRLPGVRSASDIAYPQRRICTVCLRRVSASVTVVSVSCGISRSRIAWERGGGCQAHGTSGCAGQGDRYADFRAAGAPQRLVALYLVDDHSFVAHGQPVMSDGLFDLIPQAGHGRRRHVAQGRGHRAAAHKLHEKRPRCVPAFAGLADELGSGDAATRSVLSHTDAYALRLWSCHSAANNLILTFGRRLVVPGAPGSPPEVSVR